MTDSIQQPSSPVFFQFVTHRMFKEVIKGRFILPNSRSQAGQPSISNSITKLEENAIRYVAGYVCRKVQDYFRSSKHPQKEDMILFISDFSGGHEVDETKGTEEWTNAIDRGGVWHVNDDTYTMFYFMEEESRQHFTIESAKQLDKNSKEKLVGAILINEDLHLRWNSLSSTIDEEISSDILKRIVNLYITVHGHSFTSSILELYKQKYKRKTQKSKSLRKKLAT